MQQQLAEVGRWISAVFYGVIGKVLPYINGFVMAVKSLIQMFASFLGYELPDSSGSTGSILDSMDDSLGGVSDGIDDVNSGLDDTSTGLDKAKKKAKELAGALGIDELHTFGKNTDDSTGSGSGGAGGTGGMSVDPRLLKALQDMDYLFGNIRMKAMDIRDQLLEWASILGKVVDDNIFEPIRNSWNKYGAGILKNISETKDNIVHILGGVFDVVAQKWKPFFQAASDLFFSLMETASLVTDTISTFFRHVWDSGGKYLFESLWDLATAFLKLATSVNDNFVKPVVKSLKMTLVPAFGSLLGVVLNVIGRIIKVFADVITSISKCKPVVVTLGSAFTAMFLTIKIAKILDLANSLTGAHTILKAFKMTVIDGNSVFNKMFDIFKSGKAAFETIKDTWESANLLLQSTTLFTKAKDAADKLAAISAGIHASAVDGLTISQQICATATGVLSTALNFISKHPMVIMVSAITGLVGALALFGSSQEEAKYEMDDYSESIQEQIKAVDDLKESLEQAKESTKNEEKERLAELGAVETHVKKLQDLAGESGYVDNIQLANEHIKAINKELPESVKLTKDGRVEWSKMPSEIYKNIEALKEKARVEAYSALYTEAIKTQIKAQNEQAILQQQLNGLKEEEADLMKKVSEGSYEQRSEASERLKQVKADIAGTTEAINKNKSAADKANKSVDSYEKSISEMGDSSEKATSKLKLSYKSTSDSGNKAMNSLGTKMLEVTRQHNKYVSEGKSLNDKELQTTQSTKNALIEEYVAKAVAYGKSYKDMKDILEQQGVKLTNEELKHLEDSIKNQKEAQDQEKRQFESNKAIIFNKLKDSGVKMNDETKKQYDLMLNALDSYGIKVDSKNASIYGTMLKILQTSGSNMNQEQQRQYSQMLGIMQQNGVQLNSEQAGQYRNMYNSFETYGIKINSAQGQQYSKFLSKLAYLGIDIDSEEGRQHTKSFLNAQKNGNSTGDAYITMMKKGVASKDINSDISTILSNAKKVINKNPLKILVNMPSGWDMGKSFMTSLAESVRGTNFEIPIKGMGKAAEALGLAGKIVFGGYAAGGFPDLGQIFIAREKGPELVGTMNGRNAVANNNQIIAGIEGGVARGMAAVMSMFSGGESKSDRTVIENHIHVEMNGREIAEAIDEVKSKDGFDFGMGRK